MADEVKPTPPRDPVPPITRDRMRFGESAILRMMIEVPAGQQPEDLLTVAYWTHVANELVQACQQGIVFFDCRCEDGTWYAEYLLRDAGQNWAKVDLLRKHKLNPMTPERRFTLLPGHTVTFGGQHVKWRVMRDSDQKVLRDKFNTEGDAYGWLSEYSKSLAA
jgi:hypothetical protein